MLRNLLVDWSGTLVDDLAAVAAANNLVFRHFGRPELQLEEFRERFRLPYDSFYREHLPGIALPEIEPLFQAHFGEQQQAIALLPHAPDFLRFCQSTGRRLFLLSATPETQVAAQIERLGIAPFFERIYAGIFDKRQSIREILALHALAPGETGFIGDMVHDMETAQHGGVHAIAVLTGYDSAARLASARPEVIVRDLAALRFLLEEEPAPDEILIEDLELTARVGVPPEERAGPQRLTISLRLQPRRTFAELNDDLARTVDYAVVCSSLREFVAQREDKLIESLAEEIAAHLLAQFPLARVELELRKFILPETKHVAVRIARTSPRR